MNETVKRIAELKLCGSDSRAQSYNEGLKAAIHILESCDQPQLNENQQIVLDWLKERQLKFNERPSTTIYFLTIHYPYGLDDVAKAKKAFSKLNKPEETQVLEVFFRWAQEQEEER